MRALQHHYTSCRKGQLGSAGFQTRACSEGLRPDEQREIERRGIYTPPRNVASEPTIEQIAQDYPRAFRYYQLESGRWALTYACYAGQDYSGRWGNYFAHTLIADGEPALWPIDYYEWEGWQTRLPDEEDTDELPPPLPEIDLAAIAPAESFAAAELKEFLKEAPGRQSALAAMVRAVFLRQQTSRAMVIRDDFISGLFWLACIQKCFPLSCVHEIIFSTYQFDDRNCAAINATTQETDFSFDENQRKYQFFMFDFATDQHSEIADTDSDYAAIITSWMANDPARLCDFHKFLLLFTGLEVDPQLVWAARLFQISVGEWQPSTSEELIAITGFAEKFTAPQGRERILESLGKLTSRLGPSVSSAAYEAMVSLFIGGGVATGKPAPRALAFDAWIRMFDNFVVERAIAFEPVRALRDRLIDSFSEFEQELAKMFLADSHITYIKSKLPGLQPDVIEEVLGELLISLRALGQKQAWKHPTVKVMIDALLNADEDPRQTSLRVFDMLKDDKTALVDICYRIASNEAGRVPGKAQNSRCISSGRALAVVLNSMHPDQALAIRNHLDQPETWVLLFGEWLEIIERSNDKLKTYGAYVNSVAARLKGYWNAYSTQLAQSLMECLPADLQQEQALLWVQSMDIQYFTQPFAQACIKQANHAIPIDPENVAAKRAAQQLKQVAAEYKVSLRPDRPCLLEIALAAHQNTTFEDLVGLKLQSVMTGIDALTYAEFLKGFLPAAFAKVREPVQHKALIRTLYQPQHWPDFKAVYLEALGNQSKERFTMAERVALMYWLAASWRDQKLPGLNTFESEVFDVLIKRISALSEAEVNRLTDEIWSNKKALGQAGRDRWQQVIDEVANQKRSFMSKLFGRRKP